MYVNHFGLSRRPFPATPDSTCYYPATSHEYALAQLLRAVSDDEGFALLAGAPGMGKTLLCQCMVERLEPSVVSAFLTNSHFADRTALLQAILFEFFLPYENGSEQELRLRLTEHLLKSCAEGRRAILLVDEAHHLRPDLLEELRLLGNLEAGEGKAFQVILAAQPALLDALAQPELAAIHQRLAVRASLDPMEVNEGVDYLCHHLRQVGGDPDALFEAATLEMIAKGSRGVPRVLNQAATLALQLTHEADMKRVDAEAALETLARLGLDADQSVAGEVGPDAMPQGVEANALAAAACDDGVHLFDASRPA